MYKLLVRIVLVAVAVAICPGQTRAAVYALQYGQPTNYFGTVNLSSGTFSKITSLKTTNISDIAWCPTNGMLYGISNQSVLVKLNETNGAITTVTSLSKNVQTLAFRPSDGALFAASQSKLYTINLANLKMSAIGDYGSPTNLTNHSHVGQNIRFAQNGNLYVSNNSTNTDIYQITVTNGVATWVGEAVGCPNAVFGNAGTNMYGVSMANTNSPRAELVSFNLGSFVLGGTNANGSTHQITYSPAGAGTNFPPNIIFSGSNLLPCTAPKLCCACAHCSAGNAFVVSWTSVAGQTYQLECTTNVFYGAWVPVGSSVAGTGALCAVTNYMNGVPRCFFRMKTQ